MSEGEQLDPTADGSPETRLTAWQMLREAREARGLSIVEVAQHLKLTPRQVEAMEAGDMAHLPGPAFARGFVRNYARFLNLDAAHFNSVLDVVREAPLPINSLPLGQMPGPQRWRFSALPALGIAAALLALAVAGWHYGWFEPRDEQYLADVMSQSAALGESDASTHAVSELSSSPVVVAPSASAPTVDIVAASAVVVAPAASAPAASAPMTTPATVALATSSSATSASAGVSSSSTASASKASSSAASASRSAPAAVIVAPAAAASAPAAQSAALSGPVPKGSHRLRFAFDADAWVEVRDATGKVLFSRLNAAGTEQEVQGAAPLQLVIGNAPQVRLMVDGKATELTSKTTSNVARFSLP